MGKRRLAASCIVAAACWPALAAPTAGWENVDAHRAPFPAVAHVWAAPQTPCTVVKEGGAEGDVVFDGGAIMIRKTNDAGRIVVEAPAFVAPAASCELRFWADVSAFSTRPMEAGLWLSAYDAFPQARSTNHVPRITKSDPIGSRWFGWGNDYMLKCVNSAPGMTYRKYGHCRAGADGTVRPVIVVEGPASTSTWRNWGAEDLVRAQAAWDKHWRAIAAPDRSAERADAAAFAAALAADRDHFAEVKTVDGVPRFFVDGVETPPMVYRSPERGWCVADLVRTGADKQEALARNTYAGKPLQKAGVKLGVVGVKFGDLPGGLKGYWTAKGFDVDGAVEAVRDEMRVGDESLFLLALDLSAYPQFTAEHPSEVWIKPDGKPVVGNSGSAIPDEYNDGGAPDPDDVRWPWVSYSSTLWRAAAKTNVAALVEGLRGAGLLKRIVGVHVIGYHDGQFAVPVEDHSPCAKQEYARYLAENKFAADDPRRAYSHFMQVSGFRAVEDFSRFCKRVFGKPIVAVRWCMLPFGGWSVSSYDVGAFARSDAVDVIVPQASYNLRLPGLSQGVRLPCESLRRHGKMQWFELDFRTWAALERWGRSVEATRGLGQSDDLGEWCTVHRKHAGIMIAQRMGWWYYDMAGGWFHPQGIAEECGAVRTFRAGMLGEKPDPWHPDVALVVDEAAMSLYNKPGHPQVKNAFSLVLGQWQRTALSGVPHDFLLAEDLYADPDLARRYKAIGLCAFLHPDARQKRLMGQIAERGVATFVVPEGGYSAAFFHDFAVKNGAYAALPPGVAQVDMNGNFLSVHCIVPGKHTFRLPFAARVVNAKSGKDEPVADGAFPLEMTAGETCWFKLYRSKERK